MCRGKEAAWLSGAEKSRHFRQEVAGDTACSFGFVARSLERSGREFRGIGGGVGLGARPFLVGALGFGFNPVFLVIKFDRLSKSLPQL